MEKELGGNGPGYESRILKHVMLSENGIHCRHLGQTALFPKFGCTAIAPNVAAFSNETEAKSVSFVGFPLKVVV
jgi:hypothetical protein